MTAVMLAHVWVPGAPKTKGSLDFIPGRKCECSPSCRGYLNAGRANAREGVVGSKRWRSMTAERISACMRLDLTPYSGEVSIVAAFYLSVRDPIAVRSGDLDKLLRNALDAAEDAKIYGNDVQVVSIRADKYPVDVQHAQGLALAIFAGRD
jgi:Holliday junction resolvase RusA-like endonuclease